MIKLAKPQIDVGEIIDDCTLDMRNGIRKKHIEDSKIEIVNLCKEYDELAEDQRFDRIKMVDKTKANADKDDLLYLYTGLFSKKEKTARKYYDQLILTPEHGKCPFCCQRLVNTLDHYLPKSKYPMLSIVPFNLIPVCSNCNKEKLDEVSLDKRSMIIHPYYEDFDDDIWIKAMLIEDEPVAFEFYTEKPDNWNEEKYIRAKKHFVMFNLNELYKPYAAEMFTTEIKNIKRMYNKCGEDITKDEIKERMEDQRSIRKNDWKAAVYEAIYMNDWFWKEYIKKYE